MSFREDFSEKIGIRMVGIVGGLTFCSLTADVSLVWREPMKIAYLMEAGSAFMGSLRLGQNDLMNH